MRITQGMIIRRSINRFRDQTANIDSLQQMIASGKEINDPSDDPLRFRRAARFKNMLSRNEQYIDTIERTSAWTGATEVALDQVNNLLLEAREIAQKAADETVDSDSLAVMQSRVDGILEETLSILNSKHLDKALFAGSMTDLETPFAIVSGLPVYNGDDQELQRKIADQFEVSINVSGQEIMDTNLLQGLIDLSDAIAAEDRTAIAGSIDAIKVVSDGVLQLAASIGSVQNTIDVSMERLDTMNIELQSLISDEEDVNMVEAIVKFESEQAAYNAALQSTADIVRLNVMQYFR